MKEKLFDGAYKTVLRDLNRSIGQFVNSQLYKSIVENKIIVEKISTSDEISEDIVLKIPLSELKTKIRFLYHTMEGK